SLHHIIFVYNAPSPSYIYTLSLHDALPIFSLYPLPNLPGNQATYPSFSSQREDYGQIRVDHNISAADTFFGRYTADDTDLNSATDRKSTRLNSSHVAISYAVFCLKKKKKKN